MVCQNCGASLADNVKFCRECGAKVGKKIRFCRECGASVKDGAKFCIECGSKLKLEINNHEVVVRILPEEHLLEEHNINVDFSVDTNSMGLYQENIRKEESLVKEEPKEQVEKVVIEALKRKEKESRTKIKMIKDSVIDEACEIVSDILEVVSDIIEEIIDSFFK